MDVYAALGIEKLCIEKRQAWQNLIEAHFNIVRKMADAKFARATSWEEMIAIHRKFNLSNPLSNRISIPRAILKRQQKLNRFPGHFRRC